MDWFRRHYKTFVWLMIISFLLYLVPASYVMVQPNQ